MENNSTVDNFLGQHQQTQIFRPTTVIVIFYFSNKYVTMLVFLLNHVNDYIVTLYNM